MLKYKLMENTDFKQKRVKYTQFKVIKEK